MNIEERRRQYQDLKEKYPQIDCSIDVDNGWLSLVDDLCRELSSVSLNFKVGCIKEKFGGLRAYVEFTDGDSDKAYDAAWDIISKYEDKSLSVCEQCGKPGLLREGGWIKTLCKEHAGERKPSLFKTSMDHKCSNSWNTCSECNLPSCTACSVACFQCVDAWRHKACGQKHIDETKHWGYLNDLEYLVASIGPVGKVAGTIYDGR